MAPPLLAACKPCPTLVAWSGAGAMHARDSPAQCSLHAVGALEELGTRQVQLAQAGLLPADMCTGRAAAARARLMCSSYSSVARDTRLWCCSIMGRFSS